MCMCMGAGTHMHRMWILYHHHHYCAIIGGGGGGDVVVVVTAVVVNISDGIPTQCFVVHETQLWNFYSAT